jgi:hypothetical protein
MCDNDWLMGVLILRAAMKRISHAFTHNPICVENGGAENTLKFSYLQIMVWLSPCHLRSGASLIFFSIPPYHVLWDSGTSLLKNPHSDKDKEIHRHQPSSPAVASRCPVTQMLALFFCGGGYCKGDGGCGGMAVVRAVAVVVAVTVAVALARAKVVAVAVAVAVVVVVGVTVAVAREVARAVAAAVSSGGKGSYLTFVQV